MYPAVRELPAEGTSPIAARIDIDLHRYKIAKIAKFRNARSGCPFCRFEKPEQAAAETAGDVREFGDVVGLEGIQDFPA